ncbi:MAG: head GIN domain-containing protein [Crocinitomicaceae bacterium]
MKGIVFLSMLLTNLIIFASQTERQVGEFNELLLKSKFQVSLKQGTEFKVVIEVLEEGEDVENLITEVKKGVLEIYTKKKDFKDKNFHVTVYFKDLTSIHVKNDGEVFTEPNVVIKQDSIALNCSIGGKIKVGVEANSLSATIKQGGSIMLHGKASKFYASVFTNGNLSASKLENEQAWAEVKMGGTIILKPKEYLNAFVSMGGNIKYQGEPKKVDQEVKVGGEIKKIK